MKTKNPMPYPLVLIEWIDASSRASWVDLKEIIEWAETADEDFRVHEVGWLIRETKDYILLCPQIGKDDVLGNSMKIPKGAWLRKVTLLLPAR